MTFQRDLAWQHLDFTYRSSVAHKFARYALALDYSLLPEQVAHQAKRCVLEALGCAIGAYEAPGRAICEATVQEIGGRQEATIFCSGLRTSAMNAALANSFLVRFLDYNDIGGGSHRHANQELEWTRLLNDLSISRCRRSSMHLHQKPYMNASDD